MTTATMFERAVNVAEYHARRALSAGRRNDAPTRQRHEGIMRALIEGTDYPDMGYEALAGMIGKSKAAVLKITLPVLTSA